MKIEKLDVVLSVLIIKYIYLDNKHNLNHLFYEYILWCGVLYI